MLQILDLEQAMATADALSEAAERLNTGEGVSGPLHRRRSAVPGHLPPEGSSPNVSTRPYLTTPAAARANNRELMTHFNAKGRAPS
ncbi:MAG: hypothetical protein QOE61_608 [Micromonosporaceae bacterium]|jgi:hypothetical protein|nr:hypothetical protein [Micromonosporaceae bacterium]